MGILTLKAYRKLIFTFIIVSTYESDNSDRLYYPENEFFVRSSVRGLYYVEDVSRGDIARRPESAAAQPDRQSHRPGRNLQHFIHLIHGHE